MWLSDADFKSLIGLAPLVAIELLVYDEMDRWLVGLRRNPPAQGWWFNPGGRILKGERIAEAFCRITASELGEAYEIDHARFHGVYEHFYEETFFGKGGTTHYITLAYHLPWRGGVLPTSQHNDYRWLSKEELLADERVHRYTKDYFRKGSS